MCLGCLFAIGTNQAPPLQTAPLVVSATPIHARVLAIKKRPWRCWWRWGCALPTVAPHVAVVVVVAVVASIRDKQKLLLQYFPRPWSKFLSRSATLRAANSVDVSLRHTSRCLRTLSNSYWASSRRSDRSCFYWCCTHWVMSGAWGASVAPRMCPFGTFLSGPGLPGLQLLADAPNERLIRSSSPPPSYPPPVSLYASPPPSVVAHAKPCMVQPSIITWPLMPNGIEGQHTSSLVNTPRTVNGCVHFPLQRPLPKGRVAFHAYGVVWSAQTPVSLNGRRLAYLGVPKVQKLDNHIMSFLG